MKIKTYTAACVMHATPDCPFEVTSGSQEEVLEKFWKHSNSPVHIAAHAEAIKLMGMQEEGLAGELKFMDTFRKAMKQGTYQTKSKTDDDDEK